MEKQPAQQNALWQTGYLHGHLRDTTGARIQARPLAFVLVLLRRMMQLNQPLQCCPAASLTEIKIKHYYYYTNPTYTIQYHVLFLMHEPLTAD